MKKIVFVFAIFVLAVAMAAPAHAALVPCGTEANPAPCTPCDLFKLADGVMDLFKNIALAVLTLALLAGGVIWTTSGGSPDKITQGRKMIVGSVIGIFLAFGGWLIVDTIVNTLGGGKGDLKWAWNEVGTCEAPITPPPIVVVPITPPTGVDTVDNQNAANNLVASGVQFGVVGDCSDQNGNKVSASTNLGELQRGEGLTVCQSGCKATMLKACAKTNGTLDSKLLPQIALAKNGTGINFRVESLTTGDHSPNSQHYQGKAVDIIPVTPTPENYVALREQFKAFNPTGTYIACENNSGGVVASCGSGTTHLHVSTK